MNLSFNTQLHSQALSWSTLVKLAQEGDTQALLTLCRQFEPLIDYISRKKVFYDLLGREDAKSTAALAFIDFVLHYPGKIDDRRLPGLLKRRLECGMVDQLRRSHGKYAKETLWDFTSGADSIPLEAGRIPPDHEPEGHLLAKERKETIHRAIDCLKENERYVIRQFYLLGRSPAAIAQSLRCSLRNFRRIKLLALDNLRVILQA